MPVLKPRSLINRLYYFRDAVILKLLNFPMFIMSSSNFVFIARIENSTLVDLILALFNVCAGFLAFTNGYS